VDRHSILSETIFSVVEDHCPTKKPAKKPAKSVFTLDASMENKKKPDYGLITFYSGLIFLVFLTGGFFGQKNLAPYRWLNEGLNAFRALKEQAELEATRPTLVRPIKYSGSGITKHMPEKSLHGTTLMQGNFPSGVQAKIIDMDGNILRTWPLKIYEVWPELSHVPVDKRPASEFNYTTQGMLALPDGSLIITMNHLGLVKYDRCGNVMWKINGVAHHSVTQDKDGSLWLLIKTNAADIPDEQRLPWLPKEFLLEKGWKYSDELMHISADGEIIEKFSIMDAFMEGPFEHHLRDSEFLKAGWVDPIHVNAVTVVTQELAEKLEDEGVQEGDLLISIRQFHALAIVDRETGRIKWYKNGPWVFQHSPIILPDGNIIVFNNGTGTQGYSRNRIEGSNLIKLYPDTGATEIIFPTKEADAFYSDIMGTVQHISNGNLLVAESRSGRIFEVADTDEDGAKEVVWEYVDPYDETHASLIASALRYDDDYFTHNDWSCSAP
jgi:hypothetical protein